MSISVYSLISLSSFSSITDLFPHFLTHILGPSRHVYFEGSMSFRNGGSMYVKVRAGIFLNSRHFFRISLSPSSHYIYMFQTCVLHTCSMVSQLWTYGLWLLLYFSATCDLAIPGPSPWCCQCRGGWCCWDWRGSMWTAPAPRDPCRSMESQS